jgi:hypothetical protein
LLAASVPIWTGQASFFLVFAVYIQRGRGMDALAAGVIFIASGVGRSSSRHRPDRRGDQPEAVRVAVRGRPISVAVGGAGRGASATETIFQASAPTPALA